ncbi:hypothetical protein [Planctomyces sp. SH-PL62]|uniref:hypothetical protein n=1 Tax=Planctomyces sp. SH-PL62 TaxID=1636152 RepID=UPI00078D2057|nr:hypothetical protein [Planctomyces sp. SH-PL62]AMV37670.1 hypothetical protein VT85_09555 [Planctomyces sp. SH-PL62]
MISPRLRAALFLLAAVVPAACDDAASHPAYAPDKLPPLSADDLETIRSEDARIEAEERGTPVYAKGKKPKGAVKSGD